MLSKHCTSSYNLYVALVCDDTLTISQMRVILGGNKVDCHQTGAKSGPSSTSTSNPPKFFSLLSNFGRTDRKIRHGEREPNSRTKTVISARHSRPGTTEPELGLPGHSTRCNRAPVGLCLFRRRCTIKYSNITGFRHPPEAAHKIL